MFQILMATSVLPLPPAPGISVPTSNSSETTQCQKSLNNQKDTAICWEILCSKIQNKDHRVKLLQMEIGTKTRVKRGTSSVDLYSMTEHL